MKKLLAMLLVLVLTLSMFAGCGGSSDDSEGAASSTMEKDTSKKDKDSDGGGSASASDEPLSFPLKEKVKLTAFVHTRPSVDNFDENKMTALIEEMTNIDLEFVVANNNEAQEKLNLLLATGDYPDLILASQLGPAQQALYGSQGSLVPLNDLIEAYGPNTKEILANNPIALDRITMPDGNIYNLPTISECFHCYSTQKMWINQAWLDNLGLDMPTTTDEFYDVLMAFKTQDPNGNGIADEIPYAGAYKSWEADPEAFIMNAFVYSAKQSGAERLFVDNGTVVASYAQDGWKEGLKYLQKLRQDGLMAEESFTHTADGLKQMGENPDAPLLGAFPGGYPGIATDLSGERWKDYVTVPPLKGPSGAQYTKYDPFSSVRPAFSITDTCEHPEVAMMLADLLYSKDLSKWNDQGEMGVMWQWVDDDSMKGINGEKALWEELVSIADAEPNSFWNQMGNYYNPSETRLGRYIADPGDLEAILYHETADKYQPYWPEVDMLLPPLTLTDEQSAELLSYSTAINEYVLEMIATFVLQDDSVDAGWDSYIAELEAMGLNEMLAVYQEAYDAR